MKYTSDGKCNVYAGETIIAKAYVGHNGYSVKIKQGMPRSEVIKKICEDCPAFAKNNNIDENYYPKLF